MTAIRKFVVFSLLIALIGIAAGCAGSDKNVTINLEALANSILEQTLFEDTLSLIDNISLEINFGVKPETIEESLVYMGTGATAEMIAFFKVAPDTDVSEVIKTLEVYLSDSESAWDDYNPAAYDMVKQTTIVKKGRYLLICITPDKAVFEKAVEAALE